MIILTRWNDKVVTNSFARFLGRSRVNFMKYLRLMFLCPLTSPSYLQRFSKASFKHDSIIDTCGLRASLIHSPLALPDLTGLKLRVNDTNKFNNLNTEKRDATTPEFVLVLELHIITTIRCSSQVLSKTIQT